MTYFIIIIYTTIAAVDDVDIIIIIHILVHIIILLVNFFHFDVCMCIIDVSLYLMSIAISNVIPIIIIIIIDNVLMLVHYQILTEVLHATTSSTADVAARKSSGPKWDPWNGRDSPLTN